MKWKENIGKSRVHLLHTQRLHVDKYYFMIVDRPAQRVDSGRRDISIANMTLLAFWIGFSAVFSLRASETTAQIVSGTIIEHFTI